MRFTVVAVDFTAVLGGTHLLQDTHRGLIGGRGIRGDEYDFASAFVGRQDRSAVGVIAAIRVFVVAAAV